MTASRFIVIGRRFCGPPQSGNGGYVCGMLAGQSAVPIEVRLLQPPPLDRPLEVREDPEQNRLLLLHGAELIATGRPQVLQLAVPEPPSYADALAAARGYPGFRGHPFPRCFVCGPERERGDGMRVFAGAVAGRDLWAAPWLPDASLAGADGKLAPEFIWAALDCPGYFAIGGYPRMALLGQFAARIDRRVHAGEACVVIGWVISSEGRRSCAGTAVFDGSGELCARAMATWVDLRPAVASESP
ncbi:MAG: hypothetical protein FJ191_01540 [Gammaproteobacteria bacterium]|nr:hypothetical protein [Gammaproteobacteria bacterium]